MATQRRSARTINEWNNASATFDLSLGETAATRQPFLAGIQPLPILSACIIEIAAIVHTGSPGGISPKGEGDSDEDLSIKRNAKGGRGSASVRDSGSKIGGNVQDV